MSDEQQVAWCYPGPPRTPDQATEIRRIASQLHHVGADAEQQAQRYARAVDNVEQDWHGCRATMWVRRARFTERRLRRYAEAVEECAQELDAYARLLERPTPRRFSAYAESGSDDWITLPDQDDDIESETMRIAERISRLTYDFFLPEPYPIVWYRPPVFMPMQTASHPDDEQRPGGDMTARTRAAHRVVGFAPSPAT